MGRLDLSRKNGETGFVSLPFLASFLSGNRTAFSILRGPVVVEERVLIAWALRMIRDWVAFFLVDLERYSLFFPWFFRMLDSESVVSNSLFTWLSGFIFLVWILCDSVGRKLLQLGVSESLIEQKGKRGSWFCFWFEFEFGWCGSAESHFHGGWDGQMFGWGSSLVSHRPTRFQCLDLEDCSCLRSLFWRTT